MEDETFCPICEKVMESANLVFPVKEGLGICEDCYKEILEFGRDQL